MTLPNSYTQKPGAIPAYFDAILNAQPPERFSIRFLENLEFKSTNDRTFISILKELGFLDTDGVPQERYYQFLDRTQSGRVLAEGIREAYSDLFAVNTNAHELGVDEVRNKLRTLYAGTKKDTIISHIAKTFVALCEQADFDAVEPKVKKKAEGVTDSTPEQSIEQKGQSDSALAKGILLDSLQYHINIVLPESRDQAVYDAIFKSLRQHLG